MAITTKTNKSGTVLTVFKCEAKRSGVQQPCNYEYYSAKAEHVQAVAKDHPSWCRHQQN